MIIEELANLSEVKRAADRLGITPMDVAQRLESAVLEALRSLSCREEERGYHTMRVVRDAARALA